jgi:uncharacterized protein YehS (DUF1456 family)
VLRRVRYIFDFSDQVMLSIFTLGGYEASKPELATWLAREEEAGYVLCEDEKLARFLNGLIIKNRGPKGDSIPEPETVLSNNIVLRKLKIALDLQADELLEILELNEFTLSKHELSALFRRPDHKNYRECLDQLLRNFLDGMEKHYRSFGKSQSIDAPTPTKRQPK